MGFRVKALVWDFGVGTKPESLATTWGWQTSGDSAVCLGLEKVMVGFRVWFGVLGFRLTVGFGVWFDFVFGGAGLSFRVFKHF